MSELFFGIAVGAWSVDTVSLLTIRMGRNRAGPFTYMYSPAPWLRPLIPRPIKYTFRLLYCYYYVFYGNFVTFHIKSSAFRIVPFFHLLLAFTFFFIFSHLTAVPRFFKVSLVCLSFKGIVQRKLTGVESGINRLVFLQAKVAENIVKICLSPTLCEAKIFSATYWQYRLDMTIALHVGVKKLQRPLNLD
jgi:hypothetical protein